MSWQDVEDAMWKAIARASRLPEASVVWSYQNVDEPDEDHAVITFGGERVLGIDRVHTSVDLTRPRGQEIKQEVRGVREVPFQIECFTTDRTGNNAARRLAELIRTRLRLPDIRYPLRKVGLSPFDPGPVQVLNDIPSVGFRGRAVTTIRCYVPVQDCEEYTTYIERVRGIWVALGVGRSGFASGYTGSFDSDAALSAAGRYYFGVATPATIDEAFVKNLPAVTANSFAGTFALGAGLGTKKGYIFFPTSFGAPSTFIDHVSRLTVPMSQAVSGLIVNNVSYDGYVTDNFLNAPLTLEVG